MSIEGLLEEARWNAAKYANYRSMQDVNFHHDLVGKACTSSAGKSLASHVADARQVVDNALAGCKSQGSVSFVDGNMRSELEELKKKSCEMAKLLEQIQQKVSQLELRNSSSTSVVSSAPKADAKPAAKSTNEDEEDIDLFGSDDEDDEEKDKLTKERLAAYAAKKSKKPELIAKSSILLDVKPWDDETDMAAMEKSVRSIEQDGLVWGAAKLVAVGYGIKKLQILCIVEDEKVSVEELTEKISEDFEEFVQSVDIAAFNKI